jgi:hypothetical protein
VARKKVSTPVTEAARDPVEELRAAHAALVEQDLRWRW